MEKHSPTPWHVEIVNRTFHVDAADGGFVALFVNEADAALIVEAVNEHIARHRMIDVETLDHVASERDRLRDTIRSYGETIVQLNEAAQRSELKAMRLGDLIHRLSDCILGAHLEGLEGPFHAADSLDACPNVTDNDGMEVLYGDIAEALTVLAQAQAILSEARETTGKEEP